MMPSCCLVKLTTTVRWSKLGRYNRCLLIHLGDAEAEDSKEIKLLKQTKLCLVWWLLHFLVLQKCGGMRIPYPEEFLVNTALELHSDAAAC